LTPLEQTLVPTLCVGMPSRPLCGLFPGVAEGGRRASKKAFPRGAWERVRRLDARQIVWIRADRLRDDRRVPCPRDRRDRRRISGGCVQPKSRQWSEDRCDCAELRRV